MILASCKLVSDLTMMLEKQKKDNYFCNRLFITASIYELFKERERFKKVF